LGLIGTDNLPEKMKSLFDTITANDWDIEDNRIEYWRFQNQTHS